MSAVAISPFGSSGPRSRWKARDINLTAASGYSAAVGLPEREPLGFPGPVAQINAGMYAASAALAALCVRDLHGVGQLVDVSEVESLATVHTGEEVLMWLHGWRSTQRMGLGTQAGSGFASHTFACEDGRVFLDAARNHQWRTLVSMTGRRAFKEDPRFLEVSGIDEADWPEARAHVETWMADITRRELFDHELRHQMGIAPEFDVGEVCKDPDLSAFFVEIGSDPARKIRAPGLPFRFGGLEAQTPRPAPRLAQHNQEVFCHLLGVSLKELAGMSRSGVV
jgi:crotonobetainyl-CoA:carnitine CoA-transferase CaiB-like acyl-CoA transferase